jgi:SAM-dependent methyltransferase
MDSSYALQYKELYQNHWWWRSREYLLVNVINELAGSDSLNILDFGCGDGLFFETLQKFGIVYGVESTSELVDKNGPDYNKIFVGEIFQAPFDSCSFDLILACDVLEHIEDDFSTLEKLFSLLKANGVLLLTVPSFNMLWTSHDDNNFHKRRYVKKDLESLAMKAGFSVKSSRYFFFSLCFLKLLQRASEFMVGLLNTRSSRPSLRADTIPPGIINRFLTQWFRLENHITHALNLPIGSSLILILQK